MLLHNMITIVISIGILGALILLQGFLRKELGESVRGNVPLFIVAVGALAGFCAPMQFPDLNFLHHVFIGTFVGGYVVTMSLWMYYSIPVSRAIWISLTCSAVVVVAVIVVRFITVTGGKSG